MPTPLRLDAPGPAPFVDAATLTRLLTPRAALNAVQRFFARHGRNEVFIPERIHLNVPGLDAKGNHAPGNVTVGLYMPAATHEYIGVKLAHLMPQRRPNVEAEIFFYEAPTGRLLYWGDGKPLTALRTAAMSAAAALRVMPECRRLVVFGSGIQAAAHITAFADAYPMLGAIVAVTRGTAQLAQLKAQLPPEIAARVLGANAAQALPSADCVVTTTPAPCPIFDPSLLPERCHIAAVGSGTPQMNELAPDVLRSAHVWLDTRSALRESGDCIAALTAGWRESEIMGDAFDLLGPSEPAPGTGRTLVQGVDFGGKRYYRTVFKSVGHAAQDLALLLALWEALVTEGLVQGKNE
jgi:ornithine cyclodeaminase/alanine dehydrogenase-like protein (mu-crystallin family)